MYLVAVVCSSSYSTSVAQHLYQDEDANDCKAESIADHPVVNLHCPSPLATTGTLIPPLDGHHHGEVCRPRLEGRDDTKEG